MEMVDRLDGEGRVVRGCIVDLVGKGRGGGRGQGRNGIGWKEGGGVTLYMFGCGNERVFVIVL